MRGRGRRLSKSVGLRLFARRLVEPLVKRSNTFAADRGTLAQDDSSVFAFEIGRNALAKTTSERFPLSGFEALRFASRRVRSHPSGRYARVHSFRTLLRFSTRREAALYALNPPVSIAVEEQNVAVATKRLSDCHARNRTNLLRLTGRRNHDQAA